MRVAKDVVREISRMLRDRAENRTVDGGVEVYFIEDISAAFGPGDQGQPVFQGLSFEMAGRDFHVLPSLELVIAEFDAEDVVYSIEDEVLIELTNDYLQWRFNLLSRLSI